MSGAPGRRYVLVDGDRELELSMADAYSLETSGYVRPVASTRDVWRYATTGDLDLGDVEFALGRELKLVLVRATGRRRQP